MTQEDHSPENLNNDQHKADQTPDKEKQNESHSRSSEEDLFRFRNFARHILSDVFDMERGFPGTFFDLFRRPDAVVSSFFEKSGRYLTPFRYTVFMAAIYFILYSISGVGELYEHTFTLDPSDPVYDSDTGSALFEKMFIVNQLMFSKYLALTYIFIAAPSLSVSSYLFFKKEASRFSQHFVMNLFALSHMLIFSILTFPLILYQEQLLTATWLELPLNLLYLIWMYHRYLNIRTVWKAVKAALAYILSFILLVLFSNLVQVVAAFIWYYFF